MISTLSALVSESDCRTFLIYILIVLHVVDGGRLEAERKEDEKKKSDVQAAVVAV